jgi:COP9 signalosome complex subunit 12
LCKNILRSLKAQAGGADMPALALFPRAHQVTFKYYCGVIAFLEEDYATAEEHLLSAYNLCHRGATKNIQLILTYLIPTKLLTSHRLPTETLLKQSPALDRLFSPICSAIKRADLRAFDTAMERGEEEFVKRRIYLTLERGRDIVLRNLFRKVFLAGGFDPPKGGESEPPVRRTRVPVKEFAAALQMAGAEIGDGEGGVDIDEVECLIANSIYKVSRQSLSPRALGGFLPSQGDPDGYPGGHVAASGGWTRPPAPGNRHASNQQDAPSPNYMVHRQTGAES